MLVTEHWFLFCDIFMVILAPISLVGNGFILVVIVTNRTLRKNDGLYLLSALSLADFILALFVIPFIAFLIIGWKEDDSISYNASEMLLFNVPVVCEIKINSVLTVAIAIDRFSALQWPISYKLRPRGLCVAGAVVIGIIWAIFDVTFDLSTAPFTSSPGCAAAGCFMSRKFRYYWGVSDMFLNAFAMAITVLVLFKIRALKMVQATTGIFAANPNNSGDVERTKFHQANHVAVSVLLCSGACIFLPAVFGGLGEMLGLTVFAALGPFVAVGLLACGVGNALIFGFKHSAIRQAIQSIRQKNDSQSRNLQDNIPRRY